MDAPLDKGELSREQQPQCSDITQSCTFTQVTWLSTLKCFALKNMHSFIQQTYHEHLLHALHCTKQWTQEWARRLRFMEPIYMPPHILEGPVTSLESVASRLIPLPYPSTSQNHFRSFLFALYILLVSNGTGKYRDVHMHICNVFACMCVNIYVCVYVSI